MAVEFRINTESHGYFSKIAASFLHLGSAEFFITDDLVKDETLLREGLADDNRDTHTLEFLRRHFLYTLLSTVAECGQA